MATIKLAELLPDGTIGFTCDPEEVIECFGEYDARNMVPVVLLRANELRDIQPLDLANLRVQLTETGFGRI